MIHISGSQTVEFLIKPLCFVTFTGVVNITVTAEAIASHASCDNEIVSVPERGRIDTVTRSLIVKVKPHRLTACAIRCHGDGKVMPCFFFHFNFRPKGRR